MTDEDTRNFHLEDSVGVQLPGYLAAPPAHAACRQLGAAQT